MHKKLLLRLGIPFLALTIIAACGTGDDTDPMDDEAPLIEDDDGAPLNPDEDNDDMNGDRDAGEMTDDPEYDDLEEDFENDGGTGTQ